MSPPSLPTDFAPAERASAVDLAAQSAKLMREPLIANLLDCFPEPVVVLNAERQIVLANDKLAALLHRDRDSLVGLRPGEAIGCVHVHEAPGGCGTSRHCRGCGMVAAILHTQATGCTDVQQGCLSGVGPEGPFSLDLKAFTRNLVVDGDSYTVFAIRDVSSDNRRMVLERVFFHDVLNAAGGLSGLLEIIPTAPKETLPSLSQVGHDCSLRLIEMIESQRDLAAAERGDLQVNVATVDVEALVHETIGIYRSHPAGRDRVLIAALPDSPGPVHSDAVLLGRTLGNLVKNALEASAPGETVTVGFSNDPVPTFTVHNPSVMPETIRLQIFQRSISTKGGQHRGVGTYSIKLLTEKYLAGEVSFHSLEGEGTVFEIRLPAA